MSTTLPPEPVMFADHGSDGPRIESPGAEVLRAMGLEALIELLETTAYGVCVTGENHTWVYLNPAGERIIGEPLDELRGKDYLLHFPPHERDVLLALEGTQRQGDTDFYTNTVVRPDGDREMTWSGTVMHVDGVELAPAIFHETTSMRQAQRSAADLGAAAVHSISAHGRSDVIASLLREAVSATRACAAVLLCEDGDGWVHVTASSGSAEHLKDVVAASHARLSDVVVVEELAGGRSLYVSDAADQLGADDRTRTWVDPMALERWSGATLYAVKRDGVTVGVLCALLPADLPAPSESELVLWSSLADQASVALGADRVRQHVSEASVLSERNRIARDLHDSVSQALFGMHARAQVIRRALSADDPELARQAAQDLEILARQATSEMRELLDDLRPADEGSTALVSRLRNLVDVVTTRDSLPVELSVSPVPLPSLPAPLLEHVPRIVGEALHNTVKHAGAATARVSVTVENDALTVVVEDDGRGFDPSAVEGTGLGQRTMRERTTLLGGALQVESSPARGTRIRVRVPLDE